MRHLDVKFDEVLIRLNQPETRDEMDKYGPSGRVPVLRDGELCVWDSLSICEYVAEKTGRGWPKDAQARAVARSVSAEMHSGFANLRSAWPMNARARNRHTAVTPSLEADIDRVVEIWADCRSRFGKTGGPWLFGEYSIADAMYAPVALRFNTYGAQLSEIARWYMATVIADPALQEWVSAAQNESWIIESSEVGVTHA
jgi:glutathione S-transferase